MKEPCTTRINVDPYPAQIIDQRPLTGYGKCEVSSYSIMG